MNKLQKLIKRIENEYDSLLDLGFKPTIKAQTQEELNKEWERINKLTYIIAYYNSFAMYLGQENNIHFFQYKDSDKLSYTDEDLDLELNDIIIIEGISWLKLDNDLTLEKIETLAEMSIKLPSRITELTEIDSLTEINYEWLRQKVTILYKEREKQKKQEETETKTQEEKTRKQQTNWETRVVKIGFDLNGINPKNKTGEYFRNNCWYWRRLWDLCVVVGKLDQKEMLKGMNNNCEKIGKRNHDRILKGLKEAYSDQKTWNLWVKDTDKEYMSGTDFKMDKKGNKIEIPSHPFEWNNVKEFIEFLENNEGFEIG